MSNFSFPPPEGEPVVETASDEFDELVADKVKLTGESRATVYRTAPPIRAANKAKLPESLPEIGSTVLASREAQIAFAGFGIDGLKTQLLQGLLKLGGRALDDELAVLVESKDPVVRRALRATKLLALQWLEDQRQAQDIRLKCQDLFDRIPTFSTGRLDASLIPVPEAAGLPAVPPPAKRVGAIAGVDLQPGDRLHIFMDIKGDHDRLVRLLKTHRLTDHSGNWIAGPEDYLLIVGDLLASSRYDAWGEIGTQSFAVIKTLRRLAAQGGIGFVAGPTDMAVAKRTFFRHPRYGFSAAEGQTRFVQGLAWARDWLAGTGYADPNHPYAAWMLEDGFFKLKSSHQLLNQPFLELWAGDTEPNLEPLLETLDRVVDGVCQGHWATMQDLDQEFPTLLPIGTDDLAYAEAREALVEGLLQGTGTIDFFRQSLAAQWRFRAGDQVYKVSYSGIDARAVSQWGACKEHGWQLPGLAEFLETRAGVSRLQLPRMVQLLASVGINSVAELVAWSGEEMAQRAVERRAVEGLCQALRLPRERTGFVRGWEDRRGEWISLESGGLAGADLDGGKGAMEVLGALDANAVSAYADKIWQDIFGVTAPFVTLPDGMVQWETPRWKARLEIDPSVRVLRDAHGRIQVPFRHDLTLQFQG